MKTKHFHTQRGCLSYVTYNEDTKHAALIDPSAEYSTKEYLAEIEKEGLQLIYIIETHTHADHISSAPELRSKTGAQIVRSIHAPSKSANIYVGDNTKLPLGTETLHILYTPGHTVESISIYNGNEVFTGDTLLIGGTGRTDFQIGNSEDLYDSIHEKIAELPNQTLVRPGHDYKNRNQSVLSDELHTNERILLCRESFVSTMDAHHPPKPELFEVSLAENAK